MCENWESSKNGSDEGSCAYGAQCVEAHGVDELTEWKERFDPSFSYVSRDPSDIFYFLLQVRISENENAESVRKRALREELYR